MKTIQMRAKRAGTCTDCGQPVYVGDRILWARGAGARHVNCDVAKYRGAACTACNGAGWFSVGPYTRPCRSCDGTGSRHNQDLNREVSQRRQAEVDRKSAERKGVA